MSRTEPAVESPDSPVDASERGAAPAAAPPLSLDALRAAATHWRDVHITDERIIPLDGDQQLGAIVGVDEAGERARVLLLCHTQGEPTLHWGLGVSSAGQWQHPPREMQPAGSKPFDDRAIRSPFVRDPQGHWRLELAFTRSGALADGVPRAVNCVVYDAASGRWLKHEGRDIQVRIRRPRRVGAEAINELIEPIIEHEANAGSWTLMHRFNLCHDLLDDVIGDHDADPDALALLLVWLRYSALRQLDWQRNYNTQPRELAHAQHRLTCKLAELFAPGSEAGVWARWMLSTVGRGGEGQQVRDRILHIMHRHHIKERRGTWIEQWHQKLHNNTTPDDIVICQAYIAFLEADGDVNAYWRALEAGGVTKDRLESFERPITLEPEHFPDKKDGLLHDFHEFLRLLKSVHAGEDLDTSLDAAAPLLDGGFVDWVRRLAHGRADSPAALSELIAELTRARTQLSAKIAAQRDPAATRDLLYVDLGLERVLRSACERCDLSHAPIEQLLPMTRHVLASHALVEPDGEYAASLRHLELVSLEPPRDRATLLLTLAATQRTGRAVRDATDRLHARLQPLAERLGTGCGVDKWTIPIFSEEVVRGSLAFVLAKLVRHLEPALRQRAGLGGWQVISPGDVAGRVVFTDELRRMQDAVFHEPTILIADAVAGDEEIPANVCGVLTRQTPDIVSHVAVRARNERVLLASCLDERVYEQLQTQRDHRVHVASVSTGDVRIEPDDAPRERAAALGPRIGTLRKPPLTMDVVTPESYTPDNVGGKSRQLAQLRGKLPDWVDIPPSATLTFGCFERALEHPDNASLADDYAALAERVDAEPDTVLPKLRELVQRVSLPDALRSRVEAVSREQGIALPEPREKLWRAIRGVWASKWTDRSYRARRRLDWPHDDLVMAVLLQQVVPADHAFVIHTTDPTTGDANTLYAEVVVGLGETLVGNAPGMPLGFRVNKAALVVELVSLPSKSHALRAVDGAVIARSDANGEDLLDHAGAGLHDSVMTDPAHEVTLDYVDEPIVRDEAFRERLCRSIAELGIAVEQAMGGAQDIEGAVRGDRFHALQTRPQVGL